MELEEDENVILESYFGASKKKLVLTNKRLFIHEKNRFGLKWKTSNKIALEEIEEAHGMVDTITSLSILVLKLKNGEQMQFTFSQRDAGTLNPLKSKEFRDDYLTKINQQIKKG